MYYFGKRTVTNTTMKEIVGLLDMIEKHPDILPKSREKKYTAKDTDKTFRIINYWESVGLLDNNRQSGKKVVWRKFSMMDMVFMHLLAKLREFDFSIQKLKVVKQDLEKIILMGDDDMAVCVLEYAYIRAVGAKNGGNTYLLITPDGHTDCTTQKDILFMQELGKMPEGYICINFNQLLSTRVKLGKRKIPVHSENAFVLSEKEQTILEVLRTKKYKSITIAPKEGGKSMIIECTADYKEGDTLPDYGDIVTRVQDGSIVQKTIKERIKVK